MLRVLCRLAIVAESNSLFWLNLRLVLHGLRRGRLCDGIVNIRVYLIHTASLVPISGGHRVGWLLYLQVADSLLVFGGDRRTVERLCVGSIKHQNAFSHFNWRRDLKKHTNCKLALNWAILHGL